MTTPTRFRPTVPTGPHRRVWVAAAGLLSVMALAQIGDAVSAALSRGAPAAAAVSHRGPDAPRGVPANAAVLLATPSVAPVDKPVPSATVTLDPTTSAEPSPTPSACVGCPSGTPAATSGAPSVPATSAPGTPPSRTAPAKRPATRRHTHRAADPSGRPRNPAFAPAPPANPSPYQPAGPGGAGRAAPRLGMAGPAARTGLGPLAVPDPVHRLSPRLLTYTGLGVLAISLCGMAIVGGRRRRW
jgi:hypothetical protein